MRKYTSSQRGRTQASMTTEHQDRFLPPQCYMTVVSTIKQQNPYHSLKGTSNEMTTFRSFYVRQKWTKKPAKAAQQSMSPRVHEKCTSGLHSATQFVDSQRVSKMEDYTSVYKRDFRAWNAIKHQSYKQSDPLEINHRLVTTDIHPEIDFPQVDTNSKQVPKKKELQPFASITSYRSDYVAHPLPVRTPRQKTAYQNNRSLLLDPGASLSSKAASDINRELVDGASKFSKHFNTWSLQSEFYNQLGSPPADHSRFLSTTHAHSIPHKCLILPAMYTPEKSKEPFQALSTMKDDYRAWNIQRGVSVGKGETDRLRRTSESGPTWWGTAQVSTANSKPHSLNLKPNSSFHTTDKTQRHAENQVVSGFHCISSKNEDSKMYWSTCLGRRVTWPDGNNREAPPQAHRDN